MRIGVFGGTFDPPHAGHYALAHAAQEHLELDEVLWVPANRSPFKSKWRTRSTARQRMEMVRLATADEPKFATSDLEMVRGGVSYAVDTLSELTFAQPAEYWLILGADSALGFSEWRQPERILRLCRIAVGIRPPLTESEVRAAMGPVAEGRVDFVKMAPHSASSTAIRLLAGTGKPLLHVAPPVAAFIRDNHLYDKP